jgi:hypothetical protein
MTLLKQQTSIIYLKMGLSRGFERISNGSIGGGMN